MAQIRGEWKTTAIPIIQRLYFLPLEGGDVPLTRRGFARWLVGDNDSHVDVFVFNGIVYTDEVCLLMVFLNFVSTSWLLICTG